MFGLATGIYKTYFSPANLSILIIGPDCSGKTTLLERLKVTQFSTARQLRNLAAANGGRVPLPRAPSLGSGVGDGDGNDGGRGEHHRRHNSAPVLLDRDGEANGQGQPQQQPQQPPPQPPPPQTKDDGIASAAAPTPSTPTGRQDSAVSAASSTASSRRRRFLICPAPRMYSREAMTEGDDDEDEIFDEVLLSDNGIDDTSAVEEEEEDPDADLASLLGDDGLAAGAAPTTGSTQQEDDNDKQEDDEEEEEVEHDLKPAAKMLPLHLIRPTIGQNLAKIDACGCRLNIWDLGGLAKMRPLWDRYYAEVDAVVFVVDARTVAGAGGGEKSRLEDTVEAFRMVREQELLDGIPLMVFVNKVDRGEAGRVVSEDDDDNDNDNKEKVKEAQEQSSEAKDKFQPSRVDLNVLSNALNLYGPHPTKGPDYYDDDLVTMTAGSARTGEGVRAAFEWLVLKARNVQREVQRMDRKMTM